MGDISIPGLDDDDNNDEISSDETKLLGRQQVRTNASEANVSQPMKRQLVPPPTMLDTNDSDVASAEVSPITESDGKGSPVRSRFSEEESKQKSALAAMIEKFSSLENDPHARERIEGERSRSGSPHRLATSSRSTAGPSRPNLSSPALPRGAQASATPSPSPPPEPFSAEPAAARQVGRSHLRVGLKGAGAAPAIDGNLYDVVRRAAPETRETVQSRSFQKGSRRSS